MLSKQPLRMTLLLAAAMLGMSAHAESLKSREQVRTETLDAIRNGDIVTSSGLTMREINPSLYPAAPTVPGKTRYEVKSELARAERTGDMLADGETDQTLREQFPALYPAVPPASPRTRAEVVAALRHAIRTGDMLAEGEGGMTLREEFPQIYPLP